MPCSRSAGPGTRAFVVPAGANIGSMAPLLPCLWRDDDVFNGQRRVATTAPQGFVELIQSMLQSASFLFGGRSATIADFVQQSDHLTRDVRHRPRRAS